ncbi:MAG: hypothetical protein Q9178_002317 [Gyalolechia marmorata]
MAVISGKRKRREHVIDSRHSQDVEEHSTYDSRLQYILRHNFESRFEPLESFGPASAQDSFLKEDSGSENGHTDWSGFSEEYQEETETNAIVVDYQNPGKTRVDISKDDLKLFMSAKPPIESISTVSSTKRTTTEPNNSEEAATDAANLKKDLALQRLLQESHLLDPKSSLTPFGQNRHKAMDVRQQALGSRTSVFTQKKMPLAQRKGIVAKSTEREERRRREAKESGIILEKAVKSKVRDPKRERGIGAPSRKDRNEDDLPKNPQSFLDARNLDSPVSNNTRMNSLRPCSGTAKAARRCREEVDYSRHRGVAGFVPPILERVAQAPSSQPNTAGIILTDKAISLSEKHRPYYPGLPLL